MTLCRLILLTTAASVAASSLLWGRVLAPSPRGSHADRPILLAPDTGQQYPALPVAKALTRPLPAGYVLDGRFDRAVRHLARAAQCSPLPHFHWAALRSAGVSPDTPVHLDASGQLLPNALADLLAQASPRHPLAYVFDNRNLFITTADHLSSPPTVHSFPLTDLPSDPTVGPFGTHHDPLQHLTHQLALGTWSKPAFSSMPSPGIPAHYYDTGGPGLGIAHSYAGTLYVCHPDPAVIAAIPSLLDRAARDRNRAVFLDNAALLTCWAIAAVTLSHLALRLRHRRPTLAAALFAHALASSLALAISRAPAVIAYPDLRSAQDFRTWAAAPITVPSILLHDLLPANPRRDQSTTRLWLLYLLPGSALLVTFARSFRRHSRNLQGHCPTCGYDLRASPERCPECGTPAPITGPALRST